MIGRTAAAGWQADARGLFEIVAANPDAVSRLFRLLRGTDAEIVQRVRFIDLLLVEHDLGLDFEAEGAR